MPTPQLKSERNAGALCVLVVDDNLINRARAAACLEGWGFEVVHAEDGADAVQRVEQGGEFDLVLMDLQMPTMNGFAATEEIRRLEEARKASYRLPIVACSTDDVVAMGTSLQRLGFDGVLGKPYTGRELLACLARWCPDQMRGRGDRAALSGLR